MLPRASAPSPPAACLLAVLLLAACRAADPRPELAAPALGAVELDVAEAAFRELLRLEGEEESAAHCFSLGAWPERTDPPDALLARFAGSTPPVVPGSACEVSIEGTTEREGGRPAQAFTLPELSPLAEDAYRVVAEYQASGLDAAGYVCVVERRGPDGWRVRECRQEWVS